MPMKISAPGVSNKITQRTRGELQLGWNQGQAVYPSVPDSQTMPWREAVSYFGIQAQNSVFLMLLDRVDTVKDFYRLDGL